MRRGRPPPWWAELAAAGFPRVELTPAALLRPTDEEE
jgi:hypothetical protein